MPAETGPVYLPTVLSLRSESGRVGSRDGCIHGVGGQATGSDAEGAVTMPEGTAVRADHQQSSPKNPVYGLGVGWPLRHRGWSWLDSRLSHRLIGKAGGGVGGGGRWADECSLVSWAGGNRAQTAS